MQQHKYVIVFQKARPFKQLQPYLFKWKIKLLHDKQCDSGSTQATAAKICFFLLCS